MTSPSVATPALQGALTAGNASIIRCPADFLTRLRKLNEAEIITLFTPLVPHPPSTALAKNMDPFEPLGRALPRQVRHVPYRLDYGMTETHADFLPSSGAVMIVMCLTENILSRNPHAFEQQLRFARGVLKKVEEHRTMPGVPVVLLLVSSEAVGIMYAKAMQDFPALVMINDYNPTAFASAVRVLFGK